MKYLRIIIFPLAAYQLQASTFAPTRTIGVTQIQEQSNLQLQPGYAPYLEHEGTKFEKRNVAARTESEELQMKHQRDENEVQIAARIEPVAKKVRAIDAQDDRREKTGERLKQLNEKVFELAKEGGIAYENARRERDAFLASVGSEAVSLMPYQNH